MTGQLFVACVAMMLVTNQCDDSDYDLASALAAVDACLIEESIKSLYKRLAGDMNRLLHPYE